MHIHKNSMACHSPNLIISSSSSSFHCTSLNSMKPPIVKGFISLSSSLCGFEGSESEVGVLFDQLKFNGLHLSDTLTPSISIVQHFICSFCLFQIFDLTEQADVSICICTYKIMQLQRHTCWFIFDVCTFY